MKLAATPKIRNTPGQVFILPSCLVLRRSCTKITGWADVDSYLSRPTKCREDSRFLIESPYSKLFWKLENWEKFLLGYGASVLNLLSFL